MWKQVIRTNVQEEKENDMKELKDKADLIERKLKELEDDAKKDHVKRKEELQDTVNRSKSSIEESIRNFKQDLDDAREEENLERQNEIFRSIEYMKHLGKNNF